jgi:hypothetical protein
MRGVQSGRQINPSVGEPKKGCHWDQEITRTNENMPQGREEVYVLLRDMVLPHPLATQPFLGNALRLENGQLTQYNCKVIL